MQVTVYWTEIDENNFASWHATRGLYAYLSPDDNTVLYIGKVDGTTIRGRWNRSAKKGFWDYIESELKIFEHSILAGKITLPQRSRLTRELLADIESLLIRAVAPCGNIQCRNSRISRPGLTVTCKGDWPLRMRRFFDAG